MKSLYPLILLSTLSVVAVAAAGESTKGDEGDKKKSVAASTVYSFARNVDYNKFLLKKLYSELTEEQYRILGEKFMDRRITQEEIYTDVMQVLATKSFGPAFLAVLTKKPKEQICEDITNALMKVCAQVDKEKEE